MSSSLRSPSFAAFQPIEPTSPYTEQEVEEAADLGTGNAAIALVLVEAVDNETNVGVASSTGDDDDGGGTGHVKQKKNFTPSSPAYAAICLQITISAKKQENNNDNGKTTATLLVEESDNLINAVALVTCRIISIRRKNTILGPLLLRIKTETIMVAQRQNHHHHHHLVLKKVF